MCQYSLLRRRKRPRHETNDYEDVIGLIGTKEEIGYTLRMCLDVSGQIARYPPEYEVVINVHPTGNRMVRSFYISAVIFVNSFSNPIDFEGFYPIRFTSCSI